jgi:hypothetical protein
MDIMLGICLGGAIRGLKELETSGPYLEYRGAKCRFVPSYTGNSGGERGVMTHELASTPSTSLASMYTSTVLIRCPPICGPKAFIGKVKGALTQFQWILNARMCLVSVR